MSARGEAPELLDLVNPGLREIKPYVPGKSIEEARREHGRRGFVKMASNENPLGASPRAARAVARSRRRCVQYPEPTGRALREALARSLELDPAQLVLGNGADGVLYSLAMTLLDQADEVLVPEVTFSLYRILAQAMRAKVIITDMRDYRPDLNDMARRIGDRTKCLFICNPNNPTGALIPRTELEAFLHDLPPRVFAIYDEVYFDFAEPSLLPDVLGLLRRGQRNLVVVRSFSKIYGLAGARLGYAAADPALVELMHRVRPPFEVSVPALAAGRAALEDHRFYARTLALTRAQKRSVSEALQGMGLSVVPSHTNFLLVDVGTDARQVAQKLLEQGYIVRAGLSERLPHHIRVTLGTRRQNRGFLRALERVLA